MRDHTKSGPSRDGHEETNNHRHVATADAGGAKTIRDRNRPSHRSVGAERTGIAAKPLSDDNRLGRPKPTVDSKIGETIAPAALRLVANAALKGKRYVNLLRCSTMDQAETSIPDQKAINAHYATERGLVHHRDFESKGVSGSRSITRKDIDSILDAKRDGENFGVVLVHDLSRLTRAGIVRGHELRRKLAKVGILLLSAGDNLPEEEDERDLIESVIHYKNHKFSKSLSQSESRGMLSSFLEGRRPHSGITPFGYDRLYMSPNGKPIALMRSIGCGVRHILDPDTHAVQRTLISGQGRSSNFRKQSADISKLVPGSPERVKLVQQIWRWYYVDGLGGRIIATKLNKQSVKPPVAAKWSTTTVHVIVRNEQYLGRSILCRRATGWFHVFAAGRPKPVQTDSARLEELGYVNKPFERRSPSEWLEPNENVEPVEPLILDPIVRGSAEPQIEEWWLLWEEGRNKGAVRKTKHHNSSYFLKTVLRSKQGDYPLRGHTTGKHRYYFVGRLDGFGSVEKPFSNLIPAGPIEETVIAAVSETIKNHGRLGELIANHLANAKVSDPARELAQHQTEVKRLQKRIDLFYKTADIDGDEATLVETISALKLQLRQEQAAVKALVHLEGSDVIDPDRVVKSVLGQLRFVNKSLAGMPMNELRRVVEVLCPRIVVDMETKDIELHIALPKWALSSEKRIESAVCLRSTTASKSGTETNNGKWLNIAKHCFAYHKETRSGYGSYSSLGMKTGI